MKNNAFNSLRNYKFAVVALTALLLAGGASAQAQTSYTGTATTGSWFSNRWNNAADASPYTSAFTANNAASFAAGNYTFTNGGTGSVGNVTLANGATVTFSAASGTWGTGGAVRTLDIGVGSVFNLGSQAISTAAGTGFIKSGTGTLALGGGTYAGGFTLNAGTVILQGVNAMGAGGALNLNGGTVASSTTGARDLTGKYAGGITIGGNVQFGELSTVNTLAHSSGGLTFSDAMNLGSGGRTLTLGNSGTVTFGGVISNTSGGITFSATAGGTGNFGITGNVNTFTGPINITAGEVRFTSDGSIGNAANDIIIDGGRFGKANDANTVTLGAGRDIFVGDGVGTAISTAGTGILIYNRAIANKTGEIGSWAKQGTGTLSLGGESTYSGDTAINQGILLLTTGNDRLPTGTVVSLGQTASANVGTLNLNGLNQQIAGLASTTGINSSANKNTVTSATTATLDINVAEGTTRSYGAGTTQNSGVITGAIALKKSGLGTQVLGDANTYTGTTTVDAGTLAVNGSLLNSGSVLVNANGFLGGSGSVGAISGAGTVGPGNSPGILTATSVNPNAGTDFRFEFTALNPTYTSSTASGNDLLRLTSNSSPFAGGSFGAGNIISIYLNSSTINDSLLAGTNTSFSGGFFVDGTYGLASALTTASFAYYTTSALLGTGSAVDYNGTSYYSLNSEIAAKTTLSDTAVTGAGFATGTATGTLLTFNAVPEPSAQSLLAFGMVALVAVRSLRRARGDS